MSAAAAFGASQHAVLLGIDGLSIRALHEALDAGNAPNLKTLREGGIFTDDARSCQPTLSLPNWASTLFSAPPEMHGVRGTTYEENIVRPATLEAGNVWPNLFTVARAKKPALTTGAFYSWAPLGLLLPRHSMNSTVLRACRNCDECIGVEAQLTDDYLAALRSKRFGLSWLYLDVLDECGHAIGDRSKGYGQLVQMADRWVGKVLSALREANMLETTTILVMSDHGREERGFGHGEFTTGELSTQWLLSGPGVRRGKTLRGPVSIMDSAPTLLHALGVHPPLQMRGRVVREAYEEARIIDAGRGRVEKITSVGGSLATAAAAAAGSASSAGAEGGGGRGHAGRASGDALYILREVNASADSMRAIVAREMPPPFDGLLRRGVRSLMRGWDGASLRLGALLGVLAAALAYAGYSWHAEQSARQARSRRGGGHATLLGQGDELSSMRLHPAADRLRAAAGARGHGLAEEECGLLS